MTALRVLGCGVLGAIVGSGIATSIVFREGEEEWAAVPFAMLAGALAGFAVGATVGAVI